MSDKQTTLNLADAGGRIGVDAFDTGVWLSMHVPQASIHVVLTPAEARALIDALQKVIS
jgi:hypothetical protein